MSTFDEYPSLDAIAISELVRSGEVTALEVVEAAIERVEALNPSLNAVIHKLYDRARQQVGRALPSGPLSGVPFLLKDLSARLAGAPLCHGSRFFRGFIPRENTEMVNRFLSAGLVIIGKTNTPEFGLVPTTEPEAFGPTRNPWDLSKSAGGSSGGTAAAVAARMVPVGSASDGGGSIRIPASCCGLFGLKPTRGRTPVGPLRAEQWSGFSVEHALSVTVRDSAAILDAVAGPLTGDLFSLPPARLSFLDQVGSPPGKLRIAFTDQPLLRSGSIHQSCAEGVTSTVRLLEELGHECIEATPPIDSVRFGRAYVLVVSAHTHMDVVRAEVELGRKVRREDLELNTWLSAKLGAAVSAGEFLEARHTLHQISRDVLTVLEGFDAFLCPTLAMPPQPLAFLKLTGLDAVARRAARRLPISAAMKTNLALDRSTERVFAFMPFTPVFNVTGQPSMSVPLHWTADELPVGMMFTGRLGDEATLFRLAGQLERARPWRDRLPACAA